MTGLHSKVALITYHFRSAAGFRPNVFRAALRRLADVSRVEIYASNYDHFEKARICRAGAGEILIPVCPYVRNISLARVASYLQFAIRVVKTRGVWKNDIVVIFVPDYITAVAVRVVSAMFPVTIAVDVVDLWPEALPLSPAIDRFVKPLLGTLARLLRTLLFGDLVLSFQSQYFASRFQCGPADAGVIAMCGPVDYDSSVRSYPLIDHQINFVYLGSINSIIDIESFVALVAGLAPRPVRVAIIGGGQRGSKLVAGLRRSGADVKDYGFVFDPVVKRVEFAQAHFGYNGYREQTAVAVSYKAMEYLAAGLPLINSGKGDLVDIVRTDGCGINFAASSIDTVIDNLRSLTQPKYDRLRSAAAMTYKNRFAPAVFNRSVHRWFERVQARDTAQRYSVV
jgi:glycosyltransferase involved in cell wall biosynthesis